MEMLSLSPWDSAEANLLSGENGSSSDGNAQAEDIISADISAHAGGDSYKEDNDVLQINKTDNVEVLVKEDNGVLQINKTNDVEVLVKEDNGVLQINKTEAVGELNNITADAPGADKKHTGARRLFNRRNTTPDRLSSATPGKLSLLNSKILLGANASCSILNSRAIPAAMSPKRRGDFDLTDSLDRPRKYSAGGASPLLRRRTLTTPGPGPLKPPNWLEKLRMERGGFKAG